MSGNSRSLHDVAEELVRRLNNPGVTPTPSSHPLSNQNFNGSPNFNPMGNGLLAASGSGKTPQSPQQPSPPQGNSSELTGILATLPKDDLRKLKYALNEASMATTAFGVPIGALLFMINPGGWTLTVIGGGLVILTVGLQYAASEIDKQLDKMGGSP